MIAVITCRISGKRKFWNSGNELMQCKCFTVFEDDRAFSSYSALLIIIVIFYLSINSDKQLATKQKQAAKKS